MRALLVLLVAACKLEHGVAPGDGGVRGDGIDAPPDMMPDAFDPRCFGKAPFTICLQDIPMNPITLPGSVNTANAGTNNCTSLGGVVMTVSGVEACVIAGSSIDVSAARVGVFGPRPLVLLATGTITVSTASLDITSRTANPTSDGPNANPPQCMHALTEDGQPGNGGGGGGAGGSFGSRGSNGASGSNGTTAGGASRAPDTTFDMLRGGCRGGSGAGGAGTANGGSGGGALYLASQGAINITGEINASGAGGFGGLGARGGGGGGGSGGMIVLYAPTLSIAASGRVFANGGGGGGGAGNSLTDGEDGTDAFEIGVAAAGGAPGDSQGTAGAAGAFKSTAAGSATPANQGGGGGGGGVGVIRILSGQSVAPISVSPTPILN